MTTDTIQNGFTRHGIGHLSPSSLNLAMGSMSAWCVRYLLRQRFPSGYAAERGKATEVGVSHGLFNGAPDGECVELALDYFDDATAPVEGQALANLGDDEGMDKQREAIAPMVRLALAELRDYGAPEAPPEGTGQHEIALSCRFREGEGGTVHIKGFLDFYWPAMPLCVDLKSTFRAPSDWSQAHQIQAAIYQRALGVPTKFLYVTPKKAVWLALTDEQMAEALGLVKATVKRIEAYLSLSEDPELLTRAAPHDPSTFYWKGAGIGIRSTPSTRIS